MGPRGVPTGRSRRELFSGALSGPALWTLGTLGAVATLGCGPLRPAGARSGTGKWERRANIGTARDDFGLVAAAGQLIAFGGMSGERGNALDTTEIFDPKSNAWSRGPRLPLPLSSLRGVLLDNRIYAVGGAHEHQEVASAWRLAPGTAAWAPVAPLRLARMGHGLAALGGRLFAAGGLTGGEATDSVEAYDARRDHWEPVAPLPQARFNLALVASGSALYAIGGSGVDRRPTTSVSVFDPNGGTWRDGPALPQPLSNFGAAVFGERIHAVLHKLHFVLARDAPSWSYVPPMPTSRHGLGLEPLGDTLYAVGGCSEDPQRDLPVVEVYRTV